MKKLIAILMTLALVISAFALPALAEETEATADAATSATTTTAKGGRGGMPGKGQQPPAMNGSNQNGQPGMRLDFEQLVKDGVIDQELCDKILNYMKEHAPQGQPGGSVPTEDSQSPVQSDGNTPAEGSQPPARPEGVQGQQGGFEEQLLKDLLDNSIITQEQYDLLLARITVADTEAAAASETTESGI